MPEMTELQARGRMAELVAATDTLVEQASAEERDLSDVEKERKTQYRAEFDRLNSYVNDLHSLSSMESAIAARNDAGHVQADEISHGDAQTEAELLQAFMMGSKDIPGLNEQGQLIFDLTDALPPSGMTPDQVHHRMMQFALSTGDDGNVVANEGMASRIVQRMITNNPFEQVNATRLVTATGVSMDVPNIDDTGQDTVDFTENTAPADLTDSTTPAEPAFGNTPLGVAGVSTGTVDVSNQLLRDSPFQLAALIGNLLGQRIGRGFNAKLTSGTAAANFYGLAYAFAQTAFANVNFDLTSTAKTAVDREHLTTIVNAEQYVDEAYLQSAAYMMNRATWYALASLQSVTVTGAGGFTGDGDRIMQNDYSQGVPRRLNGHPVIFNNRMNTVTAGGDNNDIGVLFGSFENFWIRTVGGFMLERITEDAAYKKARKVGLIGFLDAGCRYVGPVPSAAASASNPVDLVGLLANTS